MFRTDIFRKLTLGAPANYCLCEWFSLLLQALPDVLCDIPVVKWVPHNNHFSINFYLLNWLYDLQVAIMIQFLALTDQSVCFISQISTKKYFLLVAQIHTLKAGGQLHFCYPLHSTSLQKQQHRVLTNPVFQRSPLQEGRPRPTINMVGIICSATLSGRGTLTGSSLQNLNSSCD